MGIDRKVNIHDLRASMSDSEIMEMIQSLSNEEATALMYDWHFWARPEQILPDWAWRFCLALCGRSWGKTRCGSEWIIERAKAGKGPIALIGQTKSDVRETMIEVGPSSILQISPPDFKPEYNPSNRRLTWPNGVIATAFSGDEPGQLRGPQHQCFVAGTLIDTGQDSVKRIEEIEKGSWVQTRGGMARVEAVRSYLAPTGTVKFEHDRLTGTADHPVWSEDRNRWVMMENLQQGEKVSTGDYLQTVTSAVIKMARNFINIDGSGNSLTDLYLKGTKFTIEMGTEEITVYPTWNYSPVRSTERDILQKSGNFSVDSVEINTTSRGILEGVSVRPVPTKRQTKSAKLYGPVSIAGMSFYLDLEPSVARVVSTWAPGGTKTVYSLQVSGHREYVANGIVVHNTVWVDELAKFEDPYETYNQMSMGLRIGDARCLFTTTPTPHPLIKELYRRAVTDERLSSGAKAVHLITGTTFDNAANMDPNAIDDLKKQYEGTRLGEQELYGKILWESDKAFWSQQTIDRFRVKKEEVPYPALTVLGVDPTVGDPGKGRKDSIDECGLMLAQRGIDGEGYLLGDYTIKGTPAQWAKRVAAILETENVDFIVAEQNNGGLMVQETLVAHGIPLAKIVLVNASLGKLVRAEPIALLSEQGRIHHMGEFFQLESELVTYEGKGKSPNRLDAFVWAFTYLLLGKKRATTVRRNFYRRTK